MKPDAEDQEEGLGLGDTGCVTRFNKDGSSSRKVSAHDISLCLPSGVGSMSLCGGGGSVGRSDSPAHPPPALLRGRLWGRTGCSDARPSPHSRLQGSWKRAVAGRHARRIPAISMLGRHPHSAGRALRDGSAAAARALACGARPAAAPAGAQRGTAAPATQPSGLTRLPRGLLPRARALHRTWARRWGRARAGSGLPRCLGACPGVVGAQHQLPSSSPDPHRAPGCRAEPLQGRLGMQEKPGTEAQDARHFPSV